MSSKAKQWAQVEKEVKEADKRAALIWDFVKERLQWTEDKEGENLPFIMLQCT